MAEEDNKILKYYHDEKFMIQPFVIYFDFESLLEKIDTYPKDLEKSSTIKINKHIPSGYSFFTCCLFDPKENKFDSYRGKDCRKKFCENLRERVLRITNYEKKKIISLTKEERRAHGCAKMLYMLKRIY